MSLLEIITKASANTNKLVSESKYPLILNPDPILLKLKPQIEDSNDSSLVKRVEGWQISKSDSELIDLGQNFFKNLIQKLKSPKVFNKHEFIEMLNSFLVKSSEKVGILVRIEPSDVNYTAKLIEKVGFLMGREVLGLVLEACVVLELWELLGTVIVSGKHSCSSNLVYGLIQKRRSDLVCLCVKHVRELQSSDMLGILKYFLSPSKDAYNGMVSLRKEWESEAECAIDSATNRSLSGNELSLAKEAAVLLMMAYDGFSASELCLHYLFALKDLDEVIWSSCVSKLNGSEMMGLIRYLGKWLRKYDKFPQARPCPEASSVLKLKACEWVPPLVNIVKCFGLVVDEHFSALVLHPEFHEELRSLEGVANSLSSEVRLCCTVSNLAENLKAAVKG